MAESLEQNPEKGEKPENDKGSEKERTLRNKLILVTSKLLIVILVILLALLSQK
jgi:hypothetical protein